VATLVRRYGTARLELIEDAVQAALLSSLVAWARDGLPENPTAWLFRAARNGVLDALRRSTIRDKYGATLAHALAAADERTMMSDGEVAVGAAEPRFREEVTDDTLRMLFVCADERLPEDSRLVLALKVLCGFSTEEIALRLFTSEANVHKRLTRAREKLRDQVFDDEELTAEVLRHRLPSVHAMLYLLFNEGYLSARSTEVIRRDLSFEAIRLAELLAEHPAGASSDTFALIALMLFHAARFDARMDVAGQLVLLGSQDRTRWDGMLVQGAVAWLLRSTSGPLTRYRLEAAIAAEYMLSESFSAIDWTAIASCYKALDQLSPSPLYRMNRAVAIAEAEGPKPALALLAEIDAPDWLRRFYLWDAVLGELLRRDGDLERAAEHLERAVALAPTDEEKHLLRTRLESLAPKS
jgi:RNA polymerase sigma factor (sigma-70 family)